MSSLRRHQQEGFSLIEVMTVLVIVAILASIAVPTFGRQQETAANNEARERLRNAYSAVQYDADSSRNGIVLDTRCQHVTCTPAESVDSVSATQLAANATRYDSSAGTIAVSRTVRNLATDQVTLITGGPFATGPDTIKLAFKTKQGNTWILLADNRRKPVYLKLPPNPVPAMGTERTLPSGSGPTGITTDAQGLIRYTTYSTGNLGQIGADGALSQIALTPASSGPMKLLNAEGQLWASQVAANQIAMQPALGSAEYRSTAYSASADRTKCAINGSQQPWGLARGVDGNIYYTKNSGAVGRMTPRKLTSGYCSAITAGTEVPPGTVLNEWALTAGSAPRGIALGDDGNIWFTQLNANKVAKLTPSGTMTEYTLPAANRGPNEMVLGPDGNIWFTEYTSGHIAKITPSGTVTEYAIPTANSRPYGITVGIDDAIWFTEYNTNRIGRFDPQTNSFTEYVVPTANSGPYGITTGLDGKLYFTQYGPSGNGNKIGIVEGLITESYTTQ